MSVSMNSVGSGVSEDEEEQDEDEKLVYDDDEEDVDEINHTHLHKEVVHTHSHLQTSTRKSCVSISEEYRQAQRDYSRLVEIKTDCTLNFISFSFHNFF